MSRPVECEVAEEKRRREEGLGGGGVLIGFWGLCQGLGVFGLGIPVSNVGLRAVPDSLAGGLGVRTYGVGTPI